MLRNTILYRRLWYVKRRNSRKAGILVRLALAAVLMWLAVLFLRTVIMPGILSISEEKAREVLLTSVNQSLAEVFPFGINYEDLMLLKGDTENRINTIETNSVQLNQYSEILSQKISELYNNSCYDEISVPLGTLIGIPAFTGIGPEVCSFVNPTGPVYTEIKPKITQGSNKLISMVVYLDVRLSVKIKTPLFNKLQEIKATVPLVQKSMVS